MNLRKLTLTTLAALSAMTIWCGATFTDVPTGSALAEGVQKAQSYGLMNGYSDTVFGYGDSMTRGQFVTVLCRMMGWDYDQEGAVPVAEDITDSGFYASIVTAAQQDVWDMEDATFRPDDAITRSEMCEMLVRGLGLKSAATSANKDLLFTDISGDTGYISVAYAMGMTNGISETTFAPDNTATRAQAATMLVRIYEKLQQPMSTQGFYAISSASQLPLTATMDTIHFGWSRMTWDGATALLSTVATGDNGNVFAVPGGYDDVVRALESKERNLMVFMDTTDDVAGLLSDEQGRTQAVEQIIHELTVSYSAYGANPYTGVTIDFEGLRSGQTADFNAFLTDLSAQVEALDKTLTVCVSPVLQTGTYYDGYDYKTIAGLADEILLMAYNYDATDLSGFETSTYHQTAAPAPIDQVFWGLESLVSALDGQTESIVLGLSYKYIAWQIDSDGKLLSGTPVYPALDTITARLAQETTVHGWSDTYQTPYALYETEDGSRYFLWYENQESMDAKTQVAQLLGVDTLSLWRLGNIL
ncbi:S-layer homology domain-containing protein [Bengtsoniella intestinalis]|uniref:S-layer homology domain-containing protein n=1 Tax=Bengtsoniella intestinalis TaxID=3073143 RepID=UPI00391EE511